MNTELKPKWEDAPEWANYLAMDQSGRWYWYAAKPALTPDSFAPGIGKFYPAKCYGWETTMESRP